MDLDMQLELFEIALDEIERLHGDLDNKCLEISHNGESERITITLYELPKV